MKKLLFFRSSTDKQVCAEKLSNSEQCSQQKSKDEPGSRSFRSSLFKPQNNTSENKSLDPGVALRRSRSFSSAAFMGNATTQMNLTGLSDQSSSPCSSSSSVNAQQHIRSSRGGALTPERHVKSKRSTRAPLENDYVGGKVLSSRSSRCYHDPSGNSSLSSSNVSNEVLDLYIDGEQDFERGSPARKTLLKDHRKHGFGKKPPKIHSKPASLTGSIKDTPINHSSVGTRVSEPHYSSRDWVETGISHESPKELAKQVVEKLCQTNSGTNARDFDSDVPITIEDVYGKSSNKNAPLDSDIPFIKSSGGDAEDDLDVELKSRFQEAKKKILFLSEELEQESFLYDIEFNVPALVHKVKDLTEEKINLALELAASLENQLVDRSYMKEQLRSLSLELESRTRKLQNENNDIQLAMEKELDRRSNDWSSKVEIFQAEESRLRERVRELAEKNVSLQREVSSLNEIKKDRHNMEKQVHDLTTLFEAARRESQDLSRGLSELQDKYKIADEDRVYIQRTYREKEEECKDLHASVCKLLRTCNDQEKTIDGLRGELTESLQEKHFMESSDRHVHKLQLEQIRLTGIEQTLRREVESSKTEVDALRHENISLLNRLRTGGYEYGLLTVKLDEELHGRVDLLQQQAFSLLNESTRLCSKLLESLRRVSRSVGKESSLDGQFIMESDMKVQGVRRGTESLVRSLQNVSTVLSEKSDLSSFNSQDKSIDDNIFGLRSGSKLQDFTRCEVKAEVLLTSLLKEKLYAKTQEIEQLQAEVATAARGTDILRSEVQNSLDSLSAVTHRIKELEIQMIKKEDNIHQLENNLQESTKELIFIRGVLPKVTEERDTIWEEVKQHSERNMLLSSEVNHLKKKIETLEEELLLKEGEITILRDTLGSKSFDLLASPVKNDDFLFR